MTSRDERTERVPKKDTTLTLLISPNYPALNTPTETPETTPDDDRDDDLPDREGEVDDQLDDEERKSSQAFLARLTASVNVSLKSGKSKGRSVTRRALVDKSTHELHRIVSSLFRRERGLFESLLQIQIVSPHTEQEWPAQVAADAFHVALGEATRDRRDRRDTEDATTGTETGTRQESATSETRFDAEQLPLRILWDGSYGEGLNSALAEVMTNGSTYWLVWDDFHVCVDAFLDRARPIFGRLASPQREKAEEVDECEECEECDERGKTVETTPSTSAMSSSQVAELVLSEDPNVYSRKLLRHVTDPDCGRVVVLLPHPNRAAMSDVDPDCFAGAPFRPRFSLLPSLHFVPFLRERVFLAGFEGFEEAEKTSWTALQWLFGKVWERAGGMCAVRRVPAAVALPNLWGASSGVRKVGVGKFDAGATSKARERERGTAESGDFDEDSKWSSYSLTRSKKSLAGSSPHRLQ
jgi:hypothetical protein